MKSALRVGVLGAGGVGGYVGGCMALAGANVTLIGQRPDHIERIKRDGLYLRDALGSRIARPAALHLHEAQRLALRPLDLVFLCVKSYDTGWATALIAPYLTPRGFVVSMQNGMNEECIAAIVGWQRTLGVVLNTIGVNAAAAGEVVRTTTPGGDRHIVFRVGEPDGLVTPRARQIVSLLSAADSAAVTTNLWGERWSKLVANSISHSLCTVTGLNSRGLLESASLRPLLIKMAAEGIRIGHALGYALVDIYGETAETWIAADGSDAAAMQLIEHGMRARLERVTAEERPSVAQDVARGRRTEIEFTNGLIVSKASTLRIASPLQDAVYKLVLKVERGEITPHPAACAGLAY